MTAPATSVKVIDVKVLPEQFVAALLLDAEATGASNERDIRVYAAQHPRGGGPWSLLSTEEKMQQVRLSDASERLDNIAGIFQGIRTGANDIFILQIVAEDDRCGAELLNGLGDSAVLETGLLQPVVFGTEVRKLRPSPTTSISSIRMRLGRSSAKESWNSDTPKPSSIC